MRGSWAGLLTGGIVVHDGFIPDPRVHELIQCAQLRRQRGEFGAARIGADAELQRREELRGDLTCWLAEPMFEAERALLRDLEQLRLELNREGFLGLFELELHYAWYPPGAGYARHIDQPRGRKQRKVSVVLYLNEAWTPAAGGELRFFDPGGTRDIEPVGGRLVCFLSTGREHAVLPTHGGRLSITGWFRQRDPSGSIHTERT